jgi:hypothetical protein
MYLVRINHKNGLYLEFLFLDMGKANAFAIDCAKAQNDKARCHLFDEAGRENWLDGGEFTSVQFVDLEKEVQMNMRLKELAQIIGQKWLEDMGLTPPPERAAVRAVPPSAGEVVPFAPAIGGAQFAT